MAGKGKFAAETKPECFRRVFGIKKSLPFLYFGAEGILY